MTETEEYNRAITSSFLLNDEVKALYPLYRVETSILQTGDRNLQH